MIVDSDCHIDLKLRDLGPFVEQPWRANLEFTPDHRILPHSPGDETVGGRIRRQADLFSESPGGPVKADIRIVFPTSLLPLGLHPDTMFEVVVSFGYARWLVDAYLPVNPTARAMLYLPLADPEACCRLLREFGERPGIVGAFLTNARFPRVHENRFVDVYATLQERGLALGFHPICDWMTQPFGVFDRYLPVWAVGNPFTQCVQLINWVLHGMPDRLPHLNVVFYEAGLTWLVFIAHRLDQEYMKRPTEAVVLRERPSHYIRRCFFSTQPLEQMRNPAFLEQPVRLVGHEQVVFASNFPQWDFDLPTVIAQLPFLSSSEREAILGGNARRLFRLGGAAA